MFALGGNKIGDEGMKAFSSAVSSEALASLLELCVDDGPYGIDLPQLKSACHARSTFICTDPSGALGQLNELVLRITALATGRRSQTFASTIANGPCQKSLKALR